MKYLGVIGYPLKHSLSPVVQQAAIDSAGLEARYEAWETPPEKLSAVMRRLTGPECLGANVTIPYKQAVIPYLSELDEIARRAGAVNTIVNNEGKLTGYNTDVGGFLRALREDGAFEPAGCNALVAGAGGAARAVTIGLIDAGAGSIAIINRHFDRARQLMEELWGESRQTSITALPPKTEAWEAAAANCNLLINCTSVGLAGTKQEKESPVPDHIISPGMLVFDLIYRPQETPLIVSARARSARVLGGLPMLIYQGAESFRLWTGLDAPVQDMFTAARNALSRGSGEREAAAWS